MRGLVFLGLLLVGASPMAQEAPRIRNFIPTDYQGQNQNWALAQSPEGRLYVGNNGGLLEFDGSLWQTFTLPEKQTVRAVAVGPDQRIYCGGFAEFGYWQPEADGRLTYHSLSAEVHAELLEKEEIWHILADEHGVLFQSFSTLYRYDFEKVAVIKPPSSIMFAHSVNGQVVVPVIGRGLYVLLPDNTFQFVSGTEPLADKIVQFLVPFKDGLWWAGTANAGIFVVGQGQCKPWADPLNEAFQQYQLNRAAPLRGGGWAVGTILNGLYILNADATLRFCLNRESGLQNNTVLAILEDRQGHLWLGLDRGIDLVDLPAPMTFFNDLTGKIGTVYTAAQFRGNLYLGTNQGVFIRRGKHFQLVEGTQGQVWELKAFGDRLFCGHNAGTFLIDGVKARLISDVTGGWCLLSVPERPDLLLQSTYTGLVFYQRTASGGWQMTRRVEGFAEPIQKVLFDQNGYLWGTHPNKGLYRLRISPDMTEIREYKLFSRKDGLPSDFKLDLALINNQLVVNTQTMPLRIVDSADNVWFRPLQEMPYRRKWLSGEEEDFFEVDDRDVILHAKGREYRIPVTLVPDFENIVTVSPGKYLFCLENGFALLDKRRLLEQKPGAPPVTIRRMETKAGKVLDLNKLAEISYAENSLTVRVSTPYFVRPPRFSWRLDGFSERWSDWQYGTEKDFNNLPEGNYTLRVRADTGGPEAAFPFRIRPPWYRTGWAIGLYFLVLLVLFWLIETISRRRLGRQRQRLEAASRLELARQRTEADREKLELEVENKNRELGNAALNLIRKNEALQHLRDELLRVGNDPGALKKLARQIDRHLESDHDWQLFENSFNQVHDDFIKRLMMQFPMLTPGDLRLAAFLKMNLSSKEIAPLLNISVRGVENKRYRLRKKLGLPEDSNLTEYIIGF